MAEGFVLRSGLATIVAVEQQQQSNTSQALHENNGIENNRG
jgi:hypothetical protein